MQSGHKMTTLSQIIEILRNKGYNEDFGMTNNGFTAKNAGRALSPDKVKIRKIYRFEGESNPGDMSVLYAMETDEGTKGILIDAYGTYGGNESEALAEFLNKVETEEKDI
jgi:hypothetical protein